MNPSAPAGGPPGRRPSGPTSPGGQRQPGRGPSWEDEEQRWLGPENSRPSRSVSSPQEVPGAGRRSGRGQPPQRGGSGGQRSWAGQDDDEDENWTPSGRPLAAPGPRRTSGGTAPGRPGKSKTPGTTVRNGWVVEAPARTPSSPLRTRLLLSLLLIIVVLGGAIVAVPSVRQKVLAHIPGLGQASSGQTSGNTGTLSLQINVPTAKVTVDNQAVTVQPGENGGFATATLDGLTVGDHALSIHADNFADLTTTATIKAGPNSWVAWLAPSADALTAALNQFGTPTPQPDGAVAGDHYTVNKTATSTLTVKITYTLNGLDPKAFTSQITQGDDTTKSPFQPATVSLTPTITFTDKQGNKVFETAGTTQDPIPTSQFSLQAIPSVDADGKVQITIAGVTLKTSGGQDVTTDFSGPAKTDWALYYAIAAILPASPANALSFKCIGAVDNQNFNPEDGLLIVETADDATHAHYFYRWGTLWATNGPAQTLTPNALHALPGSHEFDGANAARANASCGS
jgi:hypothetical protein